MKQVLIHIGPPKTGTSAIQYWLNCHRGILSRNGFFYPKHAIDKNKVSSGNLLSIFDLDDNNNLSINNRKLGILLKKFERSNAHTLLLSSESFFTELELLSMLFDDAKFIAYVISPLDFFESIYIQSVKRQGNTKPIDLSGRLHSPILELKNAVDQIGMQRFHLRAYSRDLFVHGDIVNDFLSYLRINLPSGSSPRKINPSYCFEALEVKRWLNQFDLDGAIDSIIDTIFQQFDEGDRYFSCIPPDIYEKNRAQNTDMLASFCQQYGVVNGDRLMELVENQPQRTYRKQAATENEFIAVASFIKIKAKPLYTYICRHIHAHSHRDHYISEYRKAFTYLTSKSVYSDSCDPFIFSSISWDQKMRLLLIRWEWLYELIVLMNRRIRKP